MKKLNSTEIISLIIAFGLITRPVWKKIFWKPMLALAKFSRETKVDWFLSVISLLYLIFFINFWKGYILFCKNKKQKDFIKKKKKYFLLSIFYTFSFLFILTATIISQIVLITKYDKL